MARKIAKTDYLMAPVNVKLVAGLLVLAIAVVFVFNFYLTAPKDKVPETCGYSSGCPIGYICYNGISTNRCMDQKCIDQCATQTHAACEGEWTTVGNYPDCTCEYTCVSDMNCQAYCNSPDRVYIECVGYLNISGEYPTCVCQKVCDTSGPV